MTVHHLQGRTEHEVLWFQRRNFVQFATGRTTREVSALERDYRFGRQFGDLAMRQWARLSEKPN